MKFLFISWLRCAYIKVSSHFLYYLFISWFILALVGKTQRDGAKPRRGDDLNKYLTLDWRKDLLKAFFLFPQRFWFLRVGVEKESNQTHDAIKVNDVTHWIESGAISFMLFCHDNYNDCGPNNKSFLASFHVRMNQLPNIMKQFSDYEHFSVFVVGKKEKQI